LRTHLASMNLRHDRLKRLIITVFETAGCHEHEAERVGHYLVEANLVGHDSHGVIRVPPYVSWLLDGKIFANRHAQVVFENDVLAIVDGQFGFGQVIGEEAMNLGIAKADKQGVAVVALRNSGHLGRIGDWALMAANAGKVSVHFVNTSGGGILAAPFGGVNRRLSANPIAAAVPVKNGSPILLDISTCAIAEGKVRVALNKGVRVPDNCLLDGDGKPTNEPKAFYGPPPGAILPFGGHKGYGLSVIVEMLAGAMTGGSCSNPKTKHVVNNMFTIVMAPDFFQTHEAFAAEVARFIAYVKASEKASPDGDILMPGEVEERTKAHRLHHGIDLDDTTWDQLVETCRSLGIFQSAVDAILRG
jgi:uncharacterized oxidoreductase